MAFLLRPSHPLLNVVLLGVNIGWSTIACQIGESQWDICRCKPFDFSAEIHPKPTSITDLFPTQTVQYVEAKKNLSIQISSFSSVPTQLRGHHGPYLFTKPSGRHEVMFRLQEEVHWMPAGRQGVDQGLCWCWPEGISTRMNRDLNHLPGWPAEKVIPVSEYTESFEVV